MVSLCHSAAMIGRGDSGSRVGLTVARRRDSIGPVETALMEATQFCIALQNKPGALGALCTSLSDAGVNVEALYISGDEDCCWVNFVAGPVRQATETLAVGGHNFFTERVLVVKVPDEPGSLEGVSVRLAEAGININYVYGSCTGGACTLVLNVDELDRAAKVLEG